MRFIGDVHGKFKQYKRLIKEVPASIQLGDMGVGFVKPKSVMYDPLDNVQYSENPPYDTMKKGDHYFIRGNHDNPSVCKRHPFWIADGTMHRGVFCVGGGLSIDRDFRTEGYDWWRDEELSQKDFNVVLDTYEDLKPNVVVTHDCPESVAQNLFGSKMKLDDPSITRQGLDAMLEIHQPAYWLFGHWHMKRVERIKNTYFICIDELGYIDLDID